MDAIPLIGLGAGGHAKVVIDVVRLDGRYRLVGLTDPNEELRGRRVMGVEVLGNDNLLPLLFQQGIRAAFIGVGTYAGTAVRAQLYRLATDLGYTFPSFIHPAATVSPTATLGAGCVVLAGAIVNAEARIGVNAIINTGAIVEHDCVVGDHAHVATGAKLAGNVTLGAGTMVGAGATVLPGRQIGPYAMVGGGAVVTRDVREGAVVAGIPAKEISKENTR